MAITLDYKVESIEERKAIVEQILEENPDPSPQYLEILADYLINCMEKQERKEKKILTENRLVTINKREQSYEGLAAQMENGEDGIYNLINTDRQVLFSPKISITKQDLETIPCLKQLRETIDMWSSALKETAGTKQAYTIKKALIEMRKDQYLIKQAYQRPLVPQKLTKSSQFSNSALDDTSYLRKGAIQIQGVSLMDPNVVTAILTNYSKLKEDSWDQFSGDVWYIIQSFEEICDRALKPYPMLKRIVELKIDKASNTEIQSTLQTEFGITHTPEYISSLWRKKIPRIIAEKAKEDFLIWQYDFNNFPMKRCSKCGRVKPANNYFFSKNNTSKDYLYSVCKKCRNKKEVGENV